jgi:hypothetical protein
MLNCPAECGAGRMFAERIIVTRDVTLIAPATNAATIEWQTTQPYESTVVVHPGARLRLENVVVRHSSPSIANNYAIFCQEGALEAVNCDISSSTGSGIGMEGGTAVLSDCRVQGCKGSGAVLAGALSNADTGLYEDSSLAPKVCCYLRAAHVLNDSCLLVDNSCTNLSPLRHSEHYKVMHASNAWTSSPTGAHQTNHGTH